MYFHISSKGAEKRTCHYHHENEQFIEVIVRMPPTCIYISLNKLELMRERERENIL